MRAWEDAFVPHGIPTAQILLTAGDFDNRTRYLNARNTILTLLEWGAVPIINENDTVSVAEIRFGDNDTLAAMVANLIRSPILVLLSVIDGLFERDPNTDPSAMPPALAASSHRHSCFGRTSRKTSNTALPGQAAATRPVSRVSATTPQASSACATASTASRTAIAGTDGIRQVTQPASRRNNTNGKTRGLLPARRSCTGARCPSVKPAAGWRPLPPYSAALRA
jgi:glutamate 5-kinase